MDLIGVIWSSGALAWGSTQSSTLGNHIHYSQALIILGLMTTVGYRFLTLTMAALELKSFRRMAQELAIFRLNHLQK